ncbi:hypothetical protein GCM10009414_11540 [Tatumella terrea]
MAGIMRENFPGNRMPQIITQHEIRTCPTAGGSPFFSRITVYFIKKAPVSGAFFCLSSARAEDITYG